MGRYEKREQIIAYVAPDVSLFRTKFALVFGTRHGVPQFAEEISGLHRQGYFTNVVISGGVTSQNNDSEASVLYEALVSRGIPEDIVILEDRAMNTGQNVIFTREKINAFAVEDLLLIGKISSKRRYIMTVRKQWPEIGRVCCHGVNYFSVPTHQWWKDQEFRGRVLSEYRKLSSYLEKGFISEVRIVNGVVL
jgi:uncharacterized SAM-binding protein YcdF (DUF218 family)